MCTRFVRPWLHSLVAEPSLHCLLTFNTLQNTRSDNFHHRLPLCLFIIQQRKQINKVSGRDYTRFTLPWFVELHWIESEKGTWSPDSPLNWMNRNFIHSFVDILLIKMFVKYYGRIFYINTFITVIQTKKNYFTEISF